ncbi:MAG: phenylalanine--tRNA ligase subunit beta [Bacteroidota bacterium]
MRILERWLKKYVRYAIPADQLAERLTMLGLEFESVERLDEKYHGFIVGEVKTVSRHPHADRLTVCDVSTGKGTLQIVCGAPNVAVGQKVVVGLVGATIPKNQHDPDGPPFVLTETAIRGIASEGMICSEFELGMGKDAAGIMVLDADARPGQSLASYFDLDDVAFDIEITPNRPDWLSHIGVAREIAALTGKPAQLPTPKVREGRESIRSRLSVTVLDAKACPRFAARMVSGVRVGPSPRWLQNALRNAGLRPRNNIVDITNYVMYECGHPLHAFDHALLRGHRIIVRRAKTGTWFTTLDGKDHELPAGAVMVCDGEREVSVAGIMGGANSEIGDSTTDVVLEAAYWNPSDIRKTAKALGISSDASQRFERGADPNGVRYALDRAAALVHELAGGTILRGTIDVYPKRIRERLVPIRVSRTNAVLGTDLSKGEVTKALTSLGMQRVSAEGDRLRFCVPTFRVDIGREIDLIEEVARIHGYDAIKTTTTATVNFVHQFPASSFGDALRSFLIGQGYQEAITNSMQTEIRSSLGGATPVRILNPQNQEMGTLRTGLVPGLMETVARNLNLGSNDLRLFELGHVFRVDESSAPKLVENFLEEERVCLVLTGLVGPVHWSGTSRKADLFDLKGDVQDLLAKFGLDKSRFISYSTTNGLTDDTLALEIQGSYAGYLGKVRKEILRQFGVEEVVYVVELSVAALQQGTPRPFVPLPRYPKVRRDVAFTIDANVPAERIEETIRATGGELLQGVILFDVYEGNPLPPGKKSVAFSLELMSLEKTLTEEEIEAAVSRVVAGVQTTHGAALRGTQ